MRLEKERVREARVEQGFIALGFEKPTSPDSILSFCECLISGVSGDATGVGTPSKSVAGSTPAPRVGVGNIVSSTSSERRREQHAAGSQASIGRRTVPQLVAGEDGSSKYSDASVPKVALEGTSKRSDFQRQMSAKSSGRRVRQLAVMQVGYFLKLCVL